MKRFTSNLPLLYLAALCGSFLTSNALAQDTMELMAHEHGMVQIPEDMPLPTIELSLSRDNKSGYNLRIKTGNFEMEPPEMANCCGASPSEQALLEGHAHIFINGNKIYRAYAEHIHLPGELFKPGINQVMVSLNDHEHNTWSVGAKMAMSTLVIDTREDAFLKYQFVSKLMR